METTLDDETHNKIRYLNFIIIRFARGFKMLIPEAFNYLDQYGGLDFLNEHYEYEHTQSEHNTCMTNIRKHAHQRAIINMRIHFIQHEVFEAPGAFLTWAERKSYQITFSRVYESQPLPDSIEEIDLLIVMGGPQSPDTGKEECPHFDAKAEIALIQKAINAGKAVVGVCLGSQLIGEALGAKFEHSPEKEIGVFPIQLTHDGLKDEKIAHFGSSLFVGHWHSDMPGLTSQSKILATSTGCPRQIISYSDLVYGFQCHPELTREVVELLIANDKDILLNNIQHRFIQKPDEILNYNYTEMNSKLFLFLDKLIAGYTVPGHKL